MKRRATSGGFTYLGLIILLAVMGLVAAAGLKMGTLLQRAAAEEELLEIGAQFAEALRSYAAATPQGKPQQPPSLQDLLKDPRFPNPRRHLRKLFVDPVTGKAEWGIVYLGDKVGVIGVYSLSMAKPLKVANFDIRFQNMENREHLSDWKFGMAIGEGGQLAVVTPANSMTGSGPAGAATPSLFTPGTGGGATGLKNGSQGEPAGSAKGGAAAAEGKPVNAPVIEPVGDNPEPEPEVEPPAQSDEEKAADAAREKEAEEREQAQEQANEQAKALEDNPTSGTTKPPPGSPPPPETGARRR